MKEDFSELIEYLDTKFTKIDDRFSKIENEVFDMNRHLQDLKENKADKSDIDNLLNAVDAYAQKADSYF